MAPPRHPHQSTMRYFVLEVVMPAFPVAVTATVLVTAR